MTLFFLSFCRILDLEVEQNQTQEETLPSSGSWLFRPSLVFLLLPPTLTPIPWQPHSCHKRRGVPERYDKQRLWTVPQRGSRKRKLLEKQSVAAAAIHNNVQHQLTAPGCHSGLWQKLRVVHPSLSSNEFVDRDGGEKVGTKWQWRLGQAFPCRQTGSTWTLVVQRLFLTRAVWPGLILTSLDSICLAGED